MRLRALLPVLALAACTAAGAWAGVPTTPDDFFLPGSQPRESGALPSAGRCGDCHGGYNAYIEMEANWRGSAMAHASRDPLFRAALAVANQDAPGAGEMCSRCHAPVGWIEGHTEGATGPLGVESRQGVQCGFCHRMVKQAGLGSNPYATDALYTERTLPVDQEVIASLSARPLDSANGMFVLDTRPARRGPFADAASRHEARYSPFHRDASLCGTCHDMSNPVLSLQADGSYAFNPFGAPAPSFDPRRMMPLERTASEWRAGAFSDPAGIEGTPFGGNRTRVSSCQDCHMADVSGAAAGKVAAMSRNDLPLHDMTGGNTAVTAMVAWLTPHAVDPAAIEAGQARARAMLSKAARLEVSVRPAGDRWVARVRVVNQAGHKLPTGFPEGRRMWVHLQATNGAGGLVYESGRYDAATATLMPDPAIKVYEHRGGLSAATAALAGLPAGRSHHTVLNDVVLCDNRIPPRGFVNAAFRDAQSAPVGAAYADGQYWDETEYVLPLEAANVTATLLYQSVTREYVEFLRDANVTTLDGDLLYDAWSATGKAAPETMTSLTTRIAPAVDRQPPARPLGLVARATSSSAIVLTWAPSLDDVGVTGYRVMRDGVPVAATPGPAYQDLGLTASTTYTYTVTAFDAAGNLSEASDPASATTRAPGVVGGRPPGRGAALFARPVAPDGTVMLEYALPAGGEVRLQIIDVAGRVVGGCVERLEAGDGVLSWPVKELPRGLYFARLTHAGGVTTTRFVVNR